MKVPIRIIALTFALLASLAASAQTTDLTLGSKNCGIYNPSQPNCYGVPAASDGTSGSVWIDYRTTPYTYGPYINEYGFVNFLNGYAGLGTAAVLNIQPDGSIQFTGTDSNGVTYYGVLSYTFTTYRGCVSGRGARCSTYWVITGGTASVQRVDY